VVQKAKGAPTPTVSVVYALANIEPTIEIQDNMVEMRQVPKEAAIDAGFSDKAEVIGRVASWAILKGCPIGAVQLAPKGTPAGMAVRIRDGFRAVAVKIDESAGVAGWIKPGSRVDVVALLDNPERGMNQSISKVILQNTEVLAVGQDSGKTGDTAAALSRSVTLLVTPEDVPKLHLAENKGKLRLAMRNQHDAVKGKENATTDNELLDLDAPAMAKKKGTDNSLLGTFLQAQAKVAPKQTDKEIKPAVETAEKPPASQPWTVEVFKGLDSVEMVQFERHTNNWQRLEGESRRSPALKARPAKSAQPSSPSLVPAKSGSLPTARAAELYEPQATGPEPEGPARIQ
jgi:pilus assembly protein CpaB